MINYDPHNWWSHFWDVRGSMLAEIVPRVAVCTAWGAVVTYLHHEHLALVLPTIGHTMVGTVLGLLLVFRTNSSYDRFWEGRKMWGSIFNESRNMARLASIALRDVPELSDRVIRWTIAFSYATTNQLRGIRNLLPYANELPADEVQQVLAANHIPTATARKITESLDEARRTGAISDYVFVTLDQNVQLLVDYLGACERIRQTPMPYAYMVHLRRALLLYCFTLPFALINDYGWWTILATLLISYLFMGIEEIGVEIENPFTDHENDLPLDEFCQRLHDQLKDYLSTSPPASAATANVSPDGNPTKA